MIAKFPHCNEKVLHAPGECVFCDDYPEEQILRALNGVDFTNDDGGWNMAVTERMLAERETMYAQLSAILDED